jgi:hypothetical protein
VKESPSFPLFEPCELRLPPLVAPFSNFRRTAVPNPFQAPDHTNHPNRSESRPAALSKDDIAGWPSKLLIDFPDFPDYSLDTVTDSLTPESA